MAFKATLKTRDSIAHITLTGELDARKGEEFLAVMKDEDQLLHPYIKFLNH